MGKPILVFRFIYLLVAGVLACLAPSQSVIAAAKRIFRTRKSEYSRPFQCKTLVQSGDKQASPGFDNIANEARDFGSRQRLLDACGYDGCFFEYRAPHTEPQCLDGSPLRSSAVPWASCFSSARSADTHVTVFRTGLREMKLTQLSWAKTVFQGAAAHLGLLTSAISANPRLSACGILFAALSLPGSHVSYIDKP